MAIPHLNAGDPRSLIAFIDITGILLTRFIKENPSLEMNPSFMAAMVTLMEIHGAMVEHHDIRLDIRDSMSIISTGKTSAELLIDSL
jgi:hypothetical protein